MRPSWVDIDLGAIATNVRAFRDLAPGSSLCAVVKADAYGHGDVPVAEAVLEAGAEWLAVALVEEGVRLRESGIEAPILLLSEPPVTDVGEIVTWSLTPTVYRHVFLEALAEVAPKGTAIHVKLDTGMHRVGCTAADLPQLLAQASSLGLDTQGVWTHFADAEGDREYTNVQIERFNEAMHPHSVAFEHLANTAGAILYPGARADMIRVGLGLYGLYPSEECRDHIDLRPAMSVRSRVSFTKRYRAGERPSYGRIRPLPADATVATVPVGYADGVPRLLSTHGGEVLIGGRRHGLAGRVTMDQIVVDCQDDEVAPGDEVVLIGAQGSQRISADDWASQTGTISYEIVCGLGPRMPRRHHS